jgi:GT2 family glycosyltransferase
MSVPGKDSVFPLVNVGVGILTYQEGPFLEYILRWLVGRVKVIVVLEDTNSMFGSAVSFGEETKAIVDKVKREVPGAASVIDFRMESFGTGKGPVQEAERRNRMAEVVGSYGCDWIWHIDADEVYDDEEAERLWLWFVSQIDGKVQGAVCSMLTYWRSMRWRIDPPEKHRPVIISKVGVKAVLARQFDAGAALVEVPPEICRMRHYSWVRTPFDAKRKVLGWGHAHQVVPGWFDSVFLKWHPGCGMRDIHPTVPGAYSSVKRCELRIPGALSGHPWSGLQLVEDSLRIKVVVLHHGMPEKADDLRCLLAEEFDGVELIDCGSTPDKMPSWVTVALPNVYWQGAWAEAMKLWSDWDVIWMLGADVLLLDSPEVYREAMEKAWPFGCWSPAVQGRAHPFMLSENYEDGACRRVKNVEGMAMAVSGNLIRTIGGKFELDTKYGFGQDYWLCAKARQGGIPNYIGGGKIYHPPGVGYNESEAHDLMEKAFSKAYGVDFRKTLFEYDSSFQGNLEGKENLRMQAKRLKLVCVDNGWGIKEFEALTKGLPVHRVVMRKGVSDFSASTTADVIPYEESLAALLDADMAFFPKVGQANRREFEMLVDAGIPTVVHADYHSGKIDHQKTGYIYQHETWATGWLNQLILNEGLRKTVSEAAKVARLAKQAPAEAVLVPPKQEPVPVAGPVVSQTPVRVTVITPTYRRDPRVVSRCIDCLRIQTEQAYEHLICSDGAEEAPIKALVGSVKDPRVSYQFTSVKKPGDFGNVVRSEMLKKAKGDFILFMDDDNVILPNYLETMIAAIEKAGAAFAVCRIVHFGPLREDAVGVPPQVLTGVPVKLYHIDTLQVLVRREAMQDIGWDMEKGYLADGHTLQKLGEKYPHVVVPEVLGFHL